MWHGLKNVLAYCAFVLFPWLLVFALGFLIYLVVQ